MVRTHIGIGNILKENNQEQHAPSVDLYIRE